MKSTPPLLPIHGRVAAILVLATLSACSSKSRSPVTTGPKTDPVTDRAKPAKSEVLASSQLPELLAEPLAGDPMGVTIHRLQNGMTVYISTDRQAPRFTAWIAVRAGSRHDPSASTGLAHYLEHMLFKGSDKLGTLDFQSEKVHLERIAALYNDLRSAADDDARAQILATIDAETQSASVFAVPNELDQLYSSIGVQGLNAFTSDDQTVYIASVPQNELVRWATIEGDRFQSPQFRLFYPELEAVYEEKNRSLDNPQWRMYEQLALALFPEHPYGTQPTIGTVEHLKVPAYADMAAYFDRWYVPNNMAIVLAGDIDAETALPVLEKAFAGFEPKPLSPPEPAELTGPTGRVERTIVAPGEQSLYLGWRTVAASHEDAIALEVMDLLMDNSVSGLLNIELVLSQKLPRAGSAPSFSNEAGFWYMHGTARGDQSLEEVEKLLIDVASKLKAGQFEDQDLAAVVLNAEISEQQQLESNDARASKMTEAYVNRVPWSEAHTRLERMRKVTKDDVLRVANRYLGDDFVVIKRVTGDFQPPKITKPSITPIKVDTTKQSELAKQVRAMKVEPLEPEWLVEGEHYQRQTLPAGDFIAVKNTRNELFELDYWFDMGSRKQKLLCHALELLERSGAGDTPAETLKREMYAMGTTITTSCDAETSRLHVEGIDRNLEASVALLDRWLRRPAFDEATVAALAKNTISLRNDQVREPRAIAQALHAFAAEGPRSSYLQVPSNRAIERAQGKAMGALLARLPDHQHRTTYFGPRNPADAAKVVALGKKHRRVQPAQPTAYRKVKGTRVFTVDQKVAQSQVRIAFPGGTTDPTAEALSRLYTEYAGGNMGALVFQEIREARGLAYSAWTVHDSGDRKGAQMAVLGGLGTQSDKTLEAIDTLLGLLRKMPLQPERFENARSALDREFRSTRVDPRAAARWVLSWNYLGLKSDPRPDIWKRLARLTAEDLQAFAMKVAAGPTIISILGDTSRFDKTALQKVGTVEPVKVDQLFGY